jgi:hypothetical protein
MIVWYLDLQLLMQSVSITTKDESSIPLLCTHTPKSSNQNALFIGYDILIESFYDGKTLTFVWRPCGRNVLMKTRISLELYHKIMVMTELYEDKDFLKNYTIRSWSWQSFNEDKDFLRIIPYDHGHDRALMKTRISLELYHTIMVMTEL